MVTSYMIAPLAQLYQLSFSPYFIAEKDNFGALRLEHMKHYGTNRLKP